LQVAGNRGAILAKKNVSGEAAMRVNDAISGAVLIIFAVAMGYLTLFFPPFPGQKYGPSLFPRLMALGLVICGALLIVRGLKARAAGDVWAVRPDWMRDGRSVISFLLMLGAILFYIFAAEPLGFLITAAIILVTLFLWLQVKPLLALPLALAATWIVHWFFTSLMRVPLPRGILTNFI
jgi:putative tricarboxylic transport membrane protein